MFFLEKSRTEDLLLKKSSKDQIALYQRKVEGHISEKSRKTSLRKKLTVFSQRRAEGLLSENRTARAFPSGCFSL